MEQKGPLFQLDPVQYFKSPPLLDDPDLLYMHTYIIHTLHSASSPSMVHGEPISHFKRGGIVEAAQHQPYSRVAACFGCFLRTALRLVACEQSTGSVYPSPCHGIAPKTICYNILSIKRSIITHCFLPISQLRHLAHHHHNLPLSLFSLCRIMCLLGCSWHIAALQGVWGT